MDARPSHRLAHRLDAVAPSATLAVTEKAAAMRAQGIDVVSFGAGEPDFPTPAHVREAAVAALAAGDTKYPAPVAGKTPLRDAVCDYLERFGGVRYDRSQVICTVGAKDALYYAFQALLNPGDEAIVPAPYWVSYPDQIRLAEATPVCVAEPQRRDQKVSAAKIAAAITPKTRVLVMNSPSNPTGAVYTRDELLAIAEVVRGKDILVISDEIYHRLVFGGASFTCFASLPGMFEQTLTVNGASKTFAMTGWRLGYAAGPRWLIAAMAKLQGQTTSGPASFIQTAMVAALSGPQDGVDEMCRTYERRARVMTAALNRIAGVNCPEPQGAFYCFPDVSGLLERLKLPSADALAEMALDRGHVALVSGSPFGSPRHIRLSYSTSDSQIDEGLRRLMKLFG